jgi:hypothetical protein
VGLIKLLHKTFDICEELKKNRDNVNIQCPIEKGPIEVSLQETAWEALLRY